MSKQEKFFDVYVSYPPNTDRERIHACLYDNLPENEVESLIKALAERPQAIVAEKCTQDERENAQHYFGYLGLDVIVRQAMELEAVEEEAVLAVNTPDPIQCPVCMTAHFAVEADSRRGQPVLDIEAFKDGREYDIVLSYPDLKIIKERIDY